MTTAFSREFLAEARFEEPSSFTFAVDFANKRIKGYTDEKDAMRQAVILIFFTQRYRWEIFSREYGAETKDLYGAPISFVTRVFERRMKDALLADGRITGASNFRFTKPSRNTLTVTFDVTTIFGDVNDVEVNIDENLS